MASLCLGGRRWAPFLMLVLMFSLAPALFAQSTEERVKELERQVEELRAEVKALENGGGAAEPDRITELERRIEVLAAELEKLKIGEAAVAAEESEHGMGPAASKVYRTERGLSIGGYGEVLYQNVSGEEMEEHEEALSEEEEEEEGDGDQLDLLRAVLYFGYKWNDRWLLNAEIEYEHAGEEVSVEFAYLDYLWRPQANLRAGLLLVPMGFLNELHEPTTFLGAQRPAVERVILPTTWRENGFGLFGDAGPFTYRTYLLNGFDASGFSEGGLGGGRQGGAEAKAEDFAWVGRLDYKGLPGLLLGGSAYFGNAGQGLETEEGKSVDAGTTIFEGHVEWRWRGLELRALAVQAEVDDVADLNRALGLSGDESVGEKLTGHYVEAGYDLLAGRSGERSLIPYGRWERYNTQDEVPAGWSADPAHDVEVLTLGVEYKPFDQIVLKLDHENVDNEAGTGRDRFNVLLGFIF